VLQVAGHGEKFDKKMEFVISALLTEPSIELAAKKSGVGEHTIYRWFNNPEFDKAYKKAKKKIVEHAITQIQQATGEAVQCLREIIKDKNNPASSRVSASKTILEQAIKTVEIEELVTRVEELENKLKGGKTA
jgi:transposase